MSENARDLILKLLNRNPQKRLGAGVRDSEEIKEYYGMSLEAVLEKVSDTYIFKVAAQTTQLANN